MFLNRIVLVYTPTSSSWLQGRVGKLVFYLLRVRSKYFRLFSSHMFCVTSSVYFLAYSIAARLLGKPFCHYQPALWTWYLIVLLTWISLNEQGSALVFPSLWNVCSHSLLLYMYLVVFLFNCKSLIFIREMTLCNIKCSKIFLTSLTSVFWFVLDFLSVGILSHIWSFILLFNKLVFYSGFCDLFRKAFPLFKTWK